MSADKSQKTIKPSPKRIREFRKEGKVAFSRDMVSVASMMLGGAVGLLLSSRSYQTLAALISEAMKAGDRMPSGMAANLSAAFFGCAAPIIMGALVGAIVAGGLQLGWPPALKKLSLNFGKVFAAQSVLQAVSPKAAGGRVFKATAKVAFVLFVLFLATRSEFTDFIRDPALSSGALASRLASAVARLGIFALLVLAALAAADYFLQRRRINRDMMMTPEEAKREQKQLEGDPVVKNKRRARAREMSQRRLTQAVAEADVVLVNPTHFAVALRYDSQRDGAPLVVAKGADHTAEKIREIARNKGVPILSRPPLTRLIYRLVPEGREVPEQLYQAVAEVLAYVYRLGLSGRVRRAD